MKIFKDWLERRSRYKEDLEAYEMYADSYRINKMSYKLKATHQAYVDYIYYRRCMLSIRDRWPSKYKAFDKIDKKYKFK